MHRRVGARQLRTGHAGLEERFVTALEEHALLRVHRRRLGDGHAKERRVEQHGAIKHAAITNVALDRAVR